MEDNEEIEEHSLPRKTESYLSQSVKQESEYVESKSEYEISMDEINSAPSLVLTEEMGGYLSDEALEINAGGLVGGPRNKLDGMVLFAKSIEVNGEIKNDYALKCDIDSGNEYFLFVIYYQRQDKQFYLKSNRNKAKNGLPFVSVSLSEAYILEKISFVMIGELHFKITPRNDKLELLQLMNDSNSEQRIFEITVDQKSATIGRDEKCEIAFPEEKSLSRVQLLVYYDETIFKWRIKDGKDKPSTNGSWLILTHSFKIHDNTEFKIGSSKLKLRVNYPNQ